jgi:hypothetical protein
MSVVFSGCITTLAQCRLRIACGWRAGIAKQARTAARRWSHARHHPC